MCQRFFKPSPCRPYFIRSRLDGSPVGLRLDEIKILAKHEGFTFVIIPGLNMNDAVQSVQF